MKLLERTPGDYDVDQLLHAFYKAELPTPFPALKAPTPLAAPRLGWAGLRSRVALAASICLLLVGGWLLAGHTADFSPPTPVGPGSGTASTKFVPFVTKPTLEKSAPNDCSKCAPGCCGK